MPNINYDNQLHTNFTPSNKVILDEILEYQPSLSLVRVKLNCQAHYITPFNQTTPFILEVSRRVR